MTRDNDTKRDTPREKAIERSIRAYLDKIGATTIKQHGTRYSRGGVADLIGCWRGRFFALEVKRPGRLATPLQGEFLKSVRRSGGLAAVVRSVDDVVACLAMGRVQDIDANTIGNVARQSKDRD